MAKKPSIATLVGGYTSASRLNTIFQQILDAFDNTVSRDGSTPNTMSADLDMNNNDLLNVKEVRATKLYAGGTQVTDATYVPNWEGEWTTATAYVVNDTVRNDGNVYICLVAHTSGTFSTDLGVGKWELFASKGSAGAGSGDMLAANNLSDLVDAAASRTNLGVSIGNDVQAFSTTLATLSSIDLSTALATKTSAAVPTTQTYTSNTTWTKPANLKYIEVEVWGGGGGSSNLSATDAGDGGTSSFGTHAVAGGGQGTQPGAYAGAGGVATAGDITISGGGGGMVDPNNYGAASGAAPRGGQGVPHRLSAPLAGLVPGGGGGSGSAQMGTGGGGAYAFARIAAADLGSTETITVGAGGTAGTGGAAGGAGMVVVTEYFSEA